MAVFNTFFKENVTQGRKSVKRWYAKTMGSLPIQDVDLILVPCHIGNNHWTLLAVDIANRHVRYYDSFTGGPPRGLVKNVLAYVTAEAERQKEFFRDGYRDMQEFDVEYLKVEDLGLEQPRQDNGSDCGVFMLKTMDFLSSGLQPTYTSADARTLRARLVLELLDQKIYDPACGEAWTRGETAGGEGGDDEDGEVVEQEKQEKPGKEEVEEEEEEGEGEEEGEEAAGEEAEAEGEEDEEEEEAEAEMEEAEEDAEDVQEAEEAERAEQESKWQGILDTTKRTDRALAKRYFPKHREAALSLLCELRAAESEALALAIKMGTILRRLMDLTTSRRFWEFVDGLERSERAVRYAIAFARMEDEKWEVSTARHVVPARTAYARAV